VKRLLILCLTLAGAIMFFTSDGAAQTGSTSSSSSGLPVEGVMPPMTGAVEWLNSPPLTTEGLRGKVVVVDFWTYTCINSIRQLPYLKAWAEKYRDKGLIVIGVHAPEFSIEQNLGNVNRATKELGISYPVAVDSNHAIWDAFNNEYWPADYFIDAKGRIRHHHYGEGDNAESEGVIRQLLTENGQTDLGPAAVQVNATGVEEAANFAEVSSPETYVGSNRADNFASPGGLVTSRSHEYRPPAKFALNQWGLDGTWTVGPEKTALDSAPGKIVFRFHARDVNLVMSPGPEGKPVRFKVTIDGQAPGNNHGVDSDGAGSGTLREPRMYQLIRQRDAIRDRTFEIEFLDPHAAAFVFTFG
jgi:thiol-disulfide isomerase/thioredoxin